MTNKNIVNQISRVLFNLGFDLEPEQPHVSGHRVILSPSKFLLLGRNRKTNRRVIIKVGNSTKAKKEISKEKRIRSALSVLHSTKGLPLPRVPKTIYFGEHQSFSILITEFISQKKIFVSYPLSKQLQFLTQALNDREQLRTTLSGWTEKERKAFPTLTTGKYIQNFKGFQASIARNYPILSLKEAMDRAFQAMNENLATMRRHDKYLIHSDFIIHNFRIKNNALFMLDCAAIRFGNKYEELARLLNYMLVHNPALEKKMKTYVLQSKGKDEYLDLKLMRIYKAGFLLHYYASLLPKASDYLLSLMIYRVDFWQEALRCIMLDQPLDKKILKTFIRNDTLLTAKEEIKRRRKYEAF